MSSLLFARLPFLPLLLPGCLHSLFERVSPSFFDPLLGSALTHFHVQLSYRSRTRAWKSCFSRIDLALNSKSRARLRSA
jgi:hypothetical protein